MDRPETDQDQLLTTGQVGALLGTTARHVVNLCLRGELPYTMTGTHRRIRRADALALAERPAGAKGGPMTADQLRSLWLHRAAAGHIATNPKRALTKARGRIDGTLDEGPAGQRWLREWLNIIDRGPEAVMRTMTSTDPRARELRQNSPFLGLLTEAERQSIIQSFELTYRAIRRAGSAVTASPGSPDTLSATRAVAWEGITDRLVRALHPSRIVLFGSMARGDARPDSDIDLLVVMPNLPSRHRTTADALRAIGPLDRDVDVLAVSESEVHARGTLPGTAIHDALTEGKVLYAGG